MKPGRSGALLLLASLALAAVPQSRDERSASVGMRSRIEQIVLAGSELVAAPTDHKAPVVLRVLAVWPHGEHHRYDLEWTGLVPGRHDLTQYLARKDGSSTTGLEPLSVTVTSVLPRGAMEPGAASPVAPPRSFGYSALQIGLAVAWALGLVLILFVGRRWRRPRVAAAAPPSLADRMRPLVEAVAGGQADAAAKAELERLLVAFWRARLGLQDRTAAAAIVAIRADAVAGALLRQVEAWLHQPTPPAALDLAALLQPYRTVAAADFEARADVR